MYSLISLLLILPTSVAGVRTFDLTITGKRCSNYDGLRHYTGPYSTPAQCFAKCEADRGGCGTCEKFSWSGGGAESGACLFSMSTTTSCSEEWWSDSDFRIYTASGTCDPAANPFALVPAAPVTIYTGLDFTGTSVQLGEGSFSFGNWCPELATYISNFPNDQMKSIKVAPGCTVTLYDGCRCPQCSPAYNQNPLVITSNASTLGDMNNKATDVVVSCPANSCSTRPTCWDGLPQYKSVFSQQCECPKRCLGDTGNLDCPVDVSAFKMVCKPKANYYPRVPMKGKPVTRCVGISGGICCQRAGVPYNYVANKCDDGSSTPVHTCPVF